MMSTGAGSKHEPRRNVPVTIFAPGTGSLASAYPATEASTSTITTANRTQTMRLFRKARSTP